MTRPSDIELLSDIEALSKIATGGIELIKTNKRFQEIARRGQASASRQTYINPKVTLPRLKFLEGHD